MTVLDISYVLNWWLLLAFIGFIFLPLTVLVFPKFFDKGYIFSKVIGLVLITFSSWFLGSIKILPFNIYSLVFILGAFLIGNFYLGSKTNFSKTINKYWSMMAFEELLFLAGFIFWSFVKAHEPSIHGLEKFMDFGFINSILQTTYFPPKDIWLTPGSINYYYFGHIIVAILTKLSFLDSTITFNLMVAFLFAITLTLSFSIGGNLVYLSSEKPKQLSVFLIGLIAAFLVTLGGNLHTIYVFFQNYDVNNPVPFWQLKPALNTTGYWYPNATRFVPYTIHEFPIYSFVVSDLHGHVLDIPIVLLTIALLITFYFKGKNLTDKTTLIYSAGIGCLIGIMLMTNILDGPIYVLAFSILMLIKNRRFFLKGLFICLLMAVILSLPFWVSFKPFGSGIGVLCAPTALTNIGKIGPLLFEKDHCAHSPLWMLLILYGFPYFIALGFLIKLKNSFTYTDRLILLLLGFSTILLIIPELVYIKDIYPLHYRANTVFKFHFQAFIILGLICSYMLYKIFQDFKLSRFNLLFMPVLYLLSILVIIYPYFAIKGYYGDLKNYQSLNGISYLSPLYPSDTDAIAWIRKNISGQPTILEANGDSYTDFARVSANTGLPTVLGWYVHEWLWRGNTDEENKRITDIQTIYQSPDLATTKQLLNKYHITLVFIGTLEQQKFLNLNQDKFNSLGKIIFQEGNTKIFRLN